MEGVSSEEAPDLLALCAVRKPALLRQVFALCATMPALIISPQKLQGRLRDPGALETIAHNLDLLEETYHLAAAEKFSLLPIRECSAPAKIVVLDNAPVAGMAPEGAGRRLGVETMPWREFLVKDPPATWGCWLTRLVGVGYRREMLEKSRFRPAG